MRTARVSGQGRASDKKRLTLAKFGENFQTYTLGKRLELLQAPLVEIPLPAL
jgi:hypothetical protein